MIMRTKTLTVRWVRPSQQPWTDDSRCWEVATRCGTGLEGLREVPGVLIDTPVEVIARAAIAAHDDSSFYAHGLPVGEVRIEHPTIAGIVTVVDPAAQPSQLRPLTLADSGRRPSVLAGAQ